MGSWFSEPQAEQRAPWVASTIIRDDGQSLLKDDETRRNQIPNEFAFESAADASGERSLTDDSDESEEPVLPMGASGSHAPRRHSVATAGRIGASDELDVHAREAALAGPRCDSTELVLFPCPKRGIAEPDRYVTQAGALRLLIMDGSSSKGLELFWAELLPTVFQELAAGFTGALRVQGASPRAGVDGTPAGPTEGVGLLQDQGVCRPRGASH